MNIDIKKRTIDGVPFESMRRVIAKNLYGYSDETLDNPFELILDLKSSPKPLTEQQKNEKIINSIISHRKLAKSPRKRKLLEILKSGPKSGKHLENVSLQIRSLVRDTNKLLRNSYEGYVISIGSTGNKSGLYEIKIAQIKSTSI